MDEQNSSTKSQSVRYRDTIVQFETVTLNNTECLVLEDVRQRFPNVTSLSIENRQLAFLRNENGTRLEPHRIKAYEHVVIDALEPEEHSNTDLSNRLDRLAQNVEDIQKSLDLIQTNSQESLTTIRQAMVQMYELHEYTTPRYFYILPIDDYNRGIVYTVKSLFQLQYKLYFLCDCSDEPGQRHVALHEGYVVKKPTEFIAAYGPYIRTTLNIVRTLLAVGSIVLPQLDKAPEFINSTGISQLTSLDSADLNFKLNAVSDLLTDVENKGSSTDLSSSIMGAFRKVPVHGAQLRELATYLDNVDKRHSLGNLYRTISDDGHVRWVCLKHYDTISFANTISTYTHQFEAFGGKFNQEMKEAVIANTHLTRETMTTLCDLLKNGFNIMTFIFEKCSCADESDLDQLFNVVLNRSSTRRLDISDLTIQNWRGKPKYTCKHMSIEIKNHIIEVHSPGRYHQNEDMKIFTRLWLQNKICRTFSIRGFGDFPEYEETFRQNSQLKSESKSLIVNHMNNLDFLNSILGRADSSPSQLKLNFCFSSPTVMSNICETLMKNQTLVELDIMNYTSFDDEQCIIKLLKSLPNHRSLKTLSLLVSNLKPSDEKERCLIDLLLLKQSFDCRLRLSDSIISQELTQAIVKASQDHHSLAYLEVYQSHMNSNDISNLRLLHTNKYLGHLTISDEPYWSVASKGMREQLQKELVQYENLELKQIIQQHETRSEIDLNGKFDSDQSMEIVATDAITMKQCKQLSLANNKITSVGALILSDALIDNTTLNTLFLNHNDLSDIGVYFLTKTLTSHNSTLQELNLANNGITDEGVKHLVFMFKTNTTLTRLNLSENDITDIGIQLLANEFQNVNAKIEKLWLSGNPSITDASVPCLIQMIKKNSTLTGLFILNSTFSDQNKAQLGRERILKPTFDLSL